MAFDGMPDVTHVAGGASWFLVSNGTCHTRSRVALSSASAHLSMYMCSVQRHPHLRLGVVDTSPIICAMGTTPGLNTCGRSPTCLALPRRRCQHWEAPSFHVRVGVWCLQRLTVCVAPAAAERSHPHVCCCAGAAPDTVGFSDTSLAFAINNQQVVTFETAYATRVGSGVGAVSVKVASFDCQYLLSMDAAIPAGDQQYWAMCGDTTSSPHIAVPGSDYVQMHYVRALPLWLCGTVAVAVCSCVV